MTIPEAAKQAGMSSETWGNIERGYKSVGRGEPRALFHPSAQLLAHAAFVVGATAAELVEVERPDAADVLTDMKQADLDVETTDVDDGKIFLLVPKDASQADRDRLQRMAQRLVDEYMRDQHGHDGSH